MEQLTLIHEDWRAALRYSVDSLGGPTKVGVALWPAKSQNEARTYLNNCLNPDRAEKLDIEEIQWILTEARKIGAHAGMTYLARECGYANPVPITPEDEQTELMRQFIAAQKAMASLMRRFEAAPPVQPRVVR